MNGVKFNFVKHNMDKIPIQNARRGKILYKSVKDIDDEKKKYKKYTLKYKGFTFQIKVGPLGNYNGYVTKFPKNLYSNFSLKERNNLGSIKGIYVPHGGYTASTGFDCAHSTDFYYHTDLTVQIKQAQSWKTHKYVESELKKIVNSLLRIADKR